ARNPSFLGTQYTKIKSARKICTRTLNSNTVAQVLTSFMGNPITAYQSIKKIWESNSNYWMIFNDSTNRDNILYAYTLYVAIQNLKQDFLSRSTSTLSNNSFTKTDSEALDLLRIRGAIWLIISATSAILPDILSDKVSNKQFIHFKRLSSIDEGADLWKPLIEAILPLAVSSFSQVLNDGLNNKMTTGKAISDFTRNFKGLIKLLPEQSSLEPLVNNTSTERPKQNSITSK
ncbi:hypothetical protein, partial [Lacticaseibacillus paracasei]|uniref:hypothetical protein n=1 Tax=Lacticaseibacillus paracasei TaxID=1597 RepID=UPI002A5A36B3